VNITHRRRLLLRIQRRPRCRIAAAAAHAQENRFHVEAGFGAARRDDALDRLDGVFVQQLENANVMLHAAMRSMLVFQGAAQFPENRR
jgi:hypothetical protein